MEVRTKLTGLVYMVMTSGLFLTSCLTSGSNFNLIFNSNLQEELDRPVLCEKPLPKWLKGTLIRNGAGQFEMGDRKLTHPFDGYAKLHSFKFRGNQTIFYSAKFLRTDFYNESVASDDIAPFSLFDSVKPPFSFWEKLLAIKNGIDNTNVNVLQFGQKDNYKNSQFVAVSDFWNSYEFGPKSLRVLDEINPAVPGNYYFGIKAPLMTTSHPVPEFGTDNYITFAHMLNPMPFGMESIDLVRIISARERQVIKHIPVKQGPYMHSFGLSRHYAVLFLCPVYVSISRYMRTMNALESFDWYPDKPTSVIVVNIYTGEQITLETENIFVMHHVNSVELSDTVVQVDMVTYPNISFFKFLKFSNIHNSDKLEKYYVQATLKRYTIDLYTKTITVRSLPSVGELDYPAHLDLPVINEAYRHFDYCYIYGSTLQLENGNVSTALSKKNLCGGPDMGWIQHDHHPLEPWYVAHPNGVREDEGVLLSVVLDGVKKESYLGVYDAQTMNQINRCSLSQIIPLTVHGRFFPEL